MRIKMAHSSLQFDEIMMSKQLRRSVFQTEIDLILSPQ
jgi:hypothetical protein